MGGLSLGKEICSLRAGGPKSKGPAPSAQGKQEESAPTPPRIRLYLQPTDLTGEDAEAEAEAEDEDEDEDEDGVEGSIKERRRALISPRPPSLDLLHSGRRDEMKSNGEGERASERARERAEDWQRTGGGGGGAEPPAKSPLPLNSCESTITASRAEPAELHAASAPTFRGGANVPRDTAAPLLLRRHFLRHQMFAAAR